VEEYQHDYGGVSANPCSSVIKSLEEYKQTDKYTRVSATLYRFSVTTNLSRKLERPNK
jgi:hypothetical protein